MRKETGAIVVEATIALTAFIFAIFTILSIVNICFIQAKMAVSLNAAAKEISQYSYLYFAMNVDDLESRFNEGTGDSKQLAKDTIDGVGTFMESLSGAAGSAQSGDFDQLMTHVDKGTSSVDSLVTQYADQLKNDPKGFILGMGKMATNELKEEGKVLLAQVLAKTFMQKNLMSNASDDADAFLRRHHIVDGMDGLDFNYTTFLPYGTNAIQLVVTYDVEVIKLLNINFKFTIRQCSKTTAWGNGVSILHPDTSTEMAPAGSVWDMGPAPRGKVIVAAEKEKYEYTDSGDGFDAYNSDENEFVSIISADTDMPSNDTPEELAKRLAEAYGDMKDSVSELGDPITVTDENGEEVTLPSDPDTRKYEVVLVVPDNADPEMVAEAIRIFQENNLGVTVTIVQDYGSPSDGGD